MDTRKQRDVTRDAADEVAGADRHPVGLPGSALEVLLVYFKLGVSSFGGPIAHIGYFREEFVVRRRWLDEQAFVDLVALCQFLPGPRSSQVGFAIGLMRAGYRGALAAWTGFTLPSAIVLVVFAYGASALNGTAGSGSLHGLKLVAVAIVAQAVWGMARTLCPDRERASIAVAAAMIILFSSSSLARSAASRSAVSRAYGFAAARRGNATGHISIPVSRADRRCGADDIFCAAGWTAHPAESFVLAGHSTVRCLLPLGRAGVRRRACRPAVAARGVRDAGLG